jgi:hypothetical protein
LFFYPFFLLCGCNRSQSHEKKEWKNLGEDSHPPFVEAPAVGRLLREGEGRWQACLKNFVAHSAEGDPPRPATRGAADFDQRARSDLESVWKKVESTGTGVFFMENTLVSLM